MESAADDMLKALAMSKTAAGTQLATNLARAEEQHKELQNFASTDSEKTRAQANFAWSKNVYLTAHQKEQLELSRKYDAVNKVATEGRHGIETYCTTAFEKMIAQAKFGLEKLAAAKQTYVAKVKAIKPESNTSQVMG